MEWESHSQSLGWHLCNQLLPFLQFAAMLIFVLIGLILSSHSLYSKILSSVLIPNLPLR